MQAPRSWGIAVEAAIIAVALGGTAIGQQKRQFMQVQVDRDSAAKSDTAFQMPEESLSGALHTLRVERSRLPLKGAAGDDQPRLVEVLTYNGRLVGPTIRVRRGETVRVTVRNELRTADPEPAALAVTSLPPATAAGIAVPRDGDGTQIDPPGGHEGSLYTTNIHTHGLHVSPIGRADDVLNVAIAPGQSHAYEYKIPDDHPTGTFWYHPHHHGAVGYQLASGLAGALIVEPGPTPAQGDLESLPQIASAAERVFVLQQLLMRDDPRRLGWVYPDDIYNPEDNRAPEPFPADPKAAPPIRKFPRQTQFSATTINGVLMPTCRLRPGEVQRWRFIHAGREEGETLAWSDSTGSPVPKAQSPLYLVALDGLATGQLTQIDSLTLYPGYRSDLLVKAPAAPGTYYLSAQPPAAARKLRKGAAPAPTRFLAKVLVAGRPVAMDLPGPEIARCRAVPTAQSIDPASVPVDKIRSVRFLLDDANKVYTINGKSFSEPLAPADAADKDQNIRPVLNTTELWKLAVAPPPDASGGPDNHPFHLHVNPFQILSVTKADDSPLDPSDAAYQHWIGLVGQWKDTILIGSDVKVTVGIRFGDWPGKTVMHCHILDHEDQGMMKTLDILDAAGQPAAAAGGQSLDLIDEAAPRVILTDTSGARRAPAEGGPRPTVAVFFRGLQCGHCAKQLRELVEATSARLGGRVTILALSDRPLPSPQDAMKRVGATDVVDFHFVEDPRREAFARFGCLRDDGPLHGLFVIDTGGRIRLRYIGEQPYAETDRVIRGVEALLPVAGSRGE